MAIDDSNSTSPEAYYNFEVKQTRKAVVITKRNDMYERNTKVNISCFGGDFNPGESVQFYYRINSESTIYLPIRYPVNENYSTDYYTFEITLPGYASRNSIYFWCRSENHDSEYSVIYTTTNSNPMIIHINPIKDEYASNEYIDIDGTIFDDSRVKLYYKFDRRDVSSLKVESTKI
ncbi:hypothetical protein TVAG_054400 [Trichomonas vaginalis G3]|uniref:Uncharacterized protein n=1 Tax=Trichomonas vaginalis (strain ATCC PRA-98 / G3) TaxID=412133 RepID=A2EYB5_TRIV3|nr:ribonuclease H protein family [Trichomonas vaginalis G3]EAY02342.1 hypothetical protein TVAG_054400 [Trichomonas vaginalis G3]KAI5514054.1 ribonuclease H protein family [Trichomonas vaginalis G3]|eukprot:XP_001314657.1 hypothetical protein [Trichomonas vaginalis G3]